MWLDQSGEMEIINHKQGIKCQLKYIPTSFFSREIERKVKGVVMDSNGEAKFVINGSWAEQIEIAPVLSTSGSSNNPEYETGPFTVVWTRQMPP